MADTADIPERSGEGEATQPMPAATMPLEVPVDAPQADGSAGDDGGTPAEAPHLADVASALVGWVRGLFAAARGYLASHRSASAATAIAAMVIVLAVSVLGLRAAQVPPDDLVTSDATERLSAPSRAVGPYDSTEPETLRSVSVTRKRKSATRKDAYDVEVSATFASSAVETTADAVLTYVRKDDSWSCVASSVTGNAAHHALAGVNQQGLTSNVESLLAAAETDGKSGASLAKLYQGASVTVAAEAFDEEAQTDTLTLHCTSPGSFVAYECDLTASFRFVAASGLWELASASVSDDARELGFKPLVGTWQGTFRSQESRSAKCLAARETGLAVAVGNVSTSQGETTIEGTLTGTAHLHADLDTDADTSEGDVALDAVPFAGTLVSDDKSEGISFLCATQDVAGGTVTLTLVFGTSKAPDAANATLVSSHTYEDTFLMLIPYQREARFADEFTLEKAE